MLSSGKRKEKNEKKDVSNVWISRPSKTHPGRVYYYNTITKRTTWEKPTEDYANTILKAKSNENLESNLKNEKRKIAKAKRRITKEGNRKLTCEESSLKKNVNLDIEDYDEHQDQYFDNVTESPKASSSGCSTSSTFQFEATHSNKVDSKETIRNFLCNMKNPKITEEISSSSKKDTNVENPKLNKKKIIDNSALVSSNLKNLESDDEKESSTHLKEGIKQRKTVKFKIKNINHKTPIQKKLLNLKTSQLKLLTAKCSNNSNSSLLKSVKSPPHSSKVDSIDSIRDFLSGKKYSVNNNKISSECSKAGKTKVSEECNNEKDVCSTNLNSFEKIEKSSAERTSNDVSEEKFEENTKFGIKKICKTPAQARLLKFKEDVKKNLKKYQENLVSYKIPKLKTTCLNSETQSESIKKSVSKIAKSVSENDLPKSDLDLSEEMDWEPCNEELDAQNINEFCESMDVTKEIFGDVFYKVNSDTSVSFPFQSTSIILVVDTNIFVSCLNFIEDLRDTFIPNLGYPVLYIPWRVLQELDHLKCSSYDLERKKLSFNARKAISYLNQNFGSRHPRCRGQSLEEFNELVVNKSCIADDEILQTCIQIQKQQKGGDVILLTNDKNLESKALVNNIAAYSKEGFVNKFLSCKTIEANNCDINLVKTSNKSDTKLTDVYVCKLKNTLEEFISSVVRTELELAFGKDWIKIAFKKPPWTLQDALNCFTKHWRSVFFLVFPKKILNYVEDLYRTISKFKLGDFDSIKHATQLSLTLLKDMKDTQKEPREYFERVDVVIKRLSNLVEEQNGTNTLCSNQLNSSETEPHSQTLMNNSMFGTEEDLQSSLIIVRDLFKNVWDSLKTFSEMLRDPASSPILNNNLIVPDTKLKLIQAHAEVIQMVELIESILQDNVENLNQNQPTINRLSKFFIHIFPTIVPEIQLKLPNCLSVFCVHPNGREMLRISLKDFIEFSTELSQAVEYINRACPST